MLVALLSAGAESEAAGHAANALQNLAIDNNTNNPILTALVQASFSLGDAFNYLLQTLQPAAQQLLELALEGGDIAALEQAIEVARVTCLAEETLQHAATRLSEINGEIARKAQCEALGVGRWRRLMSSFARSRLRRSAGLPSHHIISHPIPPHPNPVHSNSPYPIQSYASRSIPSLPISSHPTLTSICPIQSRSVPFHPVTSRTTPIPSHPISPSPVQPHPALPHHTPSTDFLLL